MWPRKQRPELIVPIRDRRQRRRILTLRNFGWMTAVFVVVFAAITVASEYNGRSRDGYGRLFGSQVSGHEVAAKPTFNVVKEAQPIPDQTAADPMLVAPAAREQYLGVDRAPAAPAQTQTQTPAFVADVAPLTAPTSATASATSTERTASRVTIVGGADGVQIVRGERQRPVLAGGIFRQP